MIEHAARIGQRLEAPAAVVLAHSRVADAAEGQFGYRCSAKARSFERKSERFTGAAFGAGLSERSASNRAAQSACSAFALSFATRRSAVPREQRTAQGLGKCCCTSFGTRRANW